MNENKENYCFTDVEVVTRIITKRRSVYADNFLKRDISRAILKQILVNATWAPTHKMTEPWRFVVLQGNQQARFGHYMEEYYKEFYARQLPAEELPAKYRYLREYPLNAACMVAVILVRHPKIVLPEWEEIAAVSSAVQNMALSCTAYGIGGYWSTTSAAMDYVTGLGLAENERSMGIFYMGYYDDGKDVPKKRRTPLAKKVSWLR